MDISKLPDNPYILLTPGPLSCSKTVKAKMLTDHCTWDAEYNNIVEDIRTRLVKIAAEKPEDYTATLMQGSGTFSVESVIGSAIPSDGKLLVIANGAYGQRIAQIASCLKISNLLLDCGETGVPDMTEIEQILKTDKAITHMAMVHCETTTGILNPVEEAGKLAATYGKIFILDAMSSFGGIPFTMEQYNASFMISSANKCIQGVPGFGFIIAKRNEMEKCKGQARSLSLDLYGQWNEMEKNHGKWRYTSPTHVVRAFTQALVELETEGGVQARFQRYSKNQKVLSDGMQNLGFKTIIPEEYQSPIITSFLYPEAEFSFESFYKKLKTEGFVIYPGKISAAPTFRIGSIGHVFPEDMERLLKAVAETRSKTLA